MITQYNDTQICHFGPSNCM